MYKRIKTLKMPTLSENGLVPWKALHTYAIGSKRRRRLHAAASRRQRRHHTTAAYHCRAAPLVTAAAMWCSKQKGRGDTILRIWTFSSEEKIGSTFFVMHAEKKGTWAPPVQFILWFATSLFTSKNRDDRTELLQGPAPLCVDMGFRGTLNQEDALIQLKSTQICWRWL